jgi:hypothetical protein
MLDWRWATGTVMVVGAACLAAATPMPASAIAAGRDLGPELTPLEVAVSRNPADAKALQSLADAYLERSAPGLAQAALDRAPTRIRESAPIADARARSLSDLGLPEPALAAQQQALEACAEETCSPAMLARAERRARWLKELVRLGVEDSLADPEKTLLAYRLAVREVRLSSH